MLYILYYGKHFHCCSTTGITSDNFFSHPLDFNIYILRVSGLSKKFKVVLDIFGTSVSLVPWCKPDDLNHI